MQYTHTHTDTLYTVCFCHDLQCMRQRRCVDDHTAPRAPRASRLRVAYYMYIYIHGRSVWCSSRSILRPCLMVGWLAGVGWLDVGWWRIVCSYRVMCTTKVYGAYICIRMAYMYGFIYMHSGQCALRDASWCGICCICIYL